jgi:hypothetical protein
MTAPTWAYVKREGITVQIVMHPSLMDEFEQWAEAREYAITPVPIDDDLPTFAVYD